MTKRHEQIIHRKINIFNHLINSDLGTIKVIANWKP